MLNEYATEDVEGVGPIRARKGTSTIELAGAASYWHKQTVAAQKANATKWRDGFLTGVVSFATLCTVVGAALRLLY